MRDIVLKSASSERRFGRQCHLRGGRRVTLAMLAITGLFGCAPSTPTPAAPAPLNGAAGSVDSASQQEGAAATTAPVALVNRPPDFELDTLKGGSVRLSDLLGSHVVLLDFWATYCDPCLVAMPHLQELYEQHQAAGLVVLGISIDGPESAASVRSTVSKLGVTFPILLDDESVVVARYNPKTSAPFSVLIGRDGSILAQQEGFTTGNAAELDAAITHALE